MYPVSMQSCRRKSGVYDLYRKSGSFANLSVLLPAVWDIRGIWLALPATAGIMTVIYGLIRKDRKMKNKVKFRQLGSVTLFVLPAFIPLIVFGFIRSCDLSILVSQTGII